MTGPKERWERLWIGPNNEKRDVPSFRDMFLTPTADIYDQVAVAAFCCTAMSLGIDSEGNMMRQPTHPILLWAFAMFLCVIQARFIIAVILEVDQREFFESFDLGHVHIWQFSSETKLALIVVVQIMVNSELMQASQMVVFCLNPLNWVNRLIPPFCVLKPVEQGGGPNIDEVVNTFTTFAWTFQVSFFVYVPTAMACLAKFAIAYYISVTSVSIIFRAGSLTEAIFNCLALTFIKDLDEDVWRLVSSNLRLKTADLQKFIKDCKHKGDFMACDCRVDDCDEEKWSFVLPQVDKSCDHGWLGFFVDSKGKAGRFLVCFILFGFYVNQLFISIDVLRCGWLPSSRQVCWLWRAMEGQGSDATGQFFGPFLRWWYSSARARFATMADPSEDGYCTGAPDEAFPSFSTWAVVFQLYPMTVLAGLIIIILFILFPPVAQSWFSETHQKRADVIIAAVARKRSLRDTLAAEGGPGGLVLPAQQ